MRYLCAVKTDLATLELIEKLSNAGITASAFDIVHEGYVFLSISTDAGEAEFETKLRGAKLAIDQRRKFHGASDASREMGWLDAADYQAMREKGGFDADKYTRVFLSLIAATHPDERESDPQAKEQRESETTTATRPEREIMLSEQRLDEMSARLDAREREQDRGNGAGKSTTETERLQIAGADATIARIRKEHGIDDGAKPSGMSAIEQAGHDRGQQILKERLTAKAQLEEANKFARQIPGIR